MELTVTNCISNLVCDDTECIEVVYLQHISVRRVGRHVLQLHHVQPFWITDTQGDDVDSILSCYSGFQKRFLSIF